MAVCHCQKDIGEKCSTAWIINIYLFEIISLGSQAVPEYLHVYNIILMLISKYCSKTAEFAIIWYF